MRLHEQQTRQLLRLRTAQRLCTLLLSLVQLEASLGRLQAASLSRPLLLSLYPSIERRLLIDELRQVMRLYHLLHILGMEDSMALHIGKKRMSLHLPRRESSTTPSSD